ncbi:MAG: cytochrome c oxidase subunit 3 [Actinomycetota bacterium]|nr:cytochrome c oxidase subunit 3 [Actinomycetota bacterium]
MSGVGTTAHGPVVEIRPGRSTAWWGMISLIATEGVLFGLLLFVYFYFWAGLGDWPPPGLPVPELVGSGVRSVILLGSTAPVILAERSLMERGDTAKCAMWLVVALAMAAMFLIGHIQEQFLLFTEISPTETAYGSAVVTILNFHAVHLIIGMMAMTFVLIHVLRRRITAERHAMLEIGGMYWHFVDVIWIFVYSALYISPRVLSG